jgi:NAD-dependent DNA ligase
MDTVGMFKNKTVCFSGRFNEFVRADAETLVIAKGGRCVGDVSKNIQYLVIGTSSGPVELSKAQQWGI